MAPPYFRFSLYMSTLFRTGPVEPMVKVVTGLRPSGYVPKAPSGLPPSLKDRCLTPLTHESMRLAPAGTFSSRLLGPGAKINKSIYGVAQIRFSHSDVSFPNMEDYRRDSTKDTTVPNRDTEESRKALTYLSYGVGGMIGLYATKNLVHTIVEFKSVAKDMQALASVEINTADIPEGASQTFMWRGKPVFVRHRTAAQISKEKDVNVSQLRHPETDEQRALHKPEWVVMMGICTHLGCVPLANMGDYGGYYCPCHGSHYDTAGRIRKGPAPENLEIPEHKFADENTLIVGSEN